MTFARLVFSALKEYALNPLSLVAVAAPDNAVLTDIFATVKLVQGICRS
jgi:hypothetical protein